MVPQPRLHTLQLSLIQRRLHVPPQIQRIIHLAFFPLILVLHFILLQINIPRIEYFLGSGLRAEAEEGHGCTEEGAGGGEEAGRGTARDGVDDVCRAVGDARGGLEFDGDEYVGWDGVVGDCGGDLAVLGVVGESREVDVGGGVGDGATVSED